MKLTKIIALAASLLIAPLANASGGGAELPYFKVDTANLGSVQRGARNFMAYCSGCHSLKYLRYNRIGKDAGIPDEMLQANLMFTSNKLGDTIKSAMPENAGEWFGAPPPDLSLTARSRGAEWVNAYLNSFYADPTRPLGVNNLVLPNASMPHVLWELQGIQHKVEHKAATEGEHHEAAAPLELVQKGTLSESEYKKFTADLTNFLAYAAEPGRADRIARGWYVLGFLVVLFGLTLALKKEYWKDIH